MPEGDPTDATDWLETDEKVEALSTDDTGESLEEDE